MGKYFNLYLINVRYYKKYYADYLSVYCMFRPQYDKYLPTGQAGSSGFFLPFQPPAPLPARRAYRPEGRAYASD